MASARWVWDPAEGTAFTHPSEFPSHDEASAKARFVDRLYGLRGVKISRVTQLEKRGSVAMIARMDGSNHEVPVARLLPWYEGLLLLQELERQAKPPEWFSQELRDVLEQERTKYGKSGVIISSALYTEKVLLGTAITGASVPDSSGKEWHYRREQTRTSEKLNLSATSGEPDPAPGSWNVRDINGYMPPWEAICHERCGVYQDFYQVCWDKPFQAVDYSRVENGCPGVPGATWEPDECLPADFDGWRIFVKKEWAKRKREQEAKEKEVYVAAKKLRTDSPMLPSGATPSPQVGDVEKKPRLAKVRRDGQPLLQDAIRSKIGHDFVPKLSDLNIQNGWPRKAEDYPAGFGPADPPGCCFPSCDCMDDARPQKPWETKKPWLEDAERSAAALAAIEALTAQTSFARRRGAVSKQCHFETISTAKIALEPYLTYSSAAKTLADVVREKIRMTFKEIPIAAISDPANPVHIPAAAFLKHDEDYEPLSFKLVSGSSSSWATVGQDDGQLLAASEPTAKPASLKIELYFGEVAAATVDITVNDGPAKPWIAPTVSIVRHFLEVQQYKLAGHARAALQEQLGHVFDFGPGTAIEEDVKAVTFGSWLSTMSVVLRMLRSTAAANVVRTEAHGPRPPSSAAVPQKPKQ